MHLDMFQKKIKKQKNYDDEKEIDADMAMR